MAAERETADRLVAAIMSDKIGASFAARIAGVTRVGLFVRLNDTGADGFIPAATLGADYFRFDEAGARARRDARPARRSGSATRSKSSSSRPRRSRARFVSKC